MSNLTPVERVTLTVWIVIGTGADDAVPASGDDADHIIDAALAQSQPQAGGGDGT